MAGLFSVGSRLTADLLNSATYRPVCKVRQTTAQTANASGALITVTFTTEDFDPLSWHDNVTNNTRVTPTIAGDYEVIAQNAIAGSTTITASYTQINLNGAMLARSGNYKPSATSSLSLGGPPWVEIVTLNGTTDYLELLMSATTSAGTWDTNVSTTGRPNLIVKYLGPTG